MTDDKPPVMVETPDLRIKAGRLQRKHRYYPPNRDSLVRLHVRWIDVPVVADDAPDDEKT